MTEYKYYQERYGALLGNYTFQGFTFPKGPGFDNLAEESELHLCGYNVNMADNLSWYILPILGLEDHARVFDLYTMPNTFGYLASMIF